MATAIIKVKNYKRTYTEGRVLLDNGSQSNFVTEEFVKKLKVKTLEERVEITGINKNLLQSMKSTNLEMASRFGTYGVNLSCIVLPQITQSLPTIVIDKTKLEIPRNIKLADPQFNIPSKIDLLIDTDTFWTLMCIGQIKLGER